jgi:hypothetical protein
VLSPCLISIGLISIAGGRRHGFRHLAPANSCPATRNRHGVFQSRQMKMGKAAIQVSALHNNGYALADAAGWAIQN